MSGITPILDTLLHQVLGKRVDVPLARQIPEPVRPLSPAEAPPAVRSDSRLDPRGLPLPDLPAAGQRARAPQAPAMPVEPASGSTQTHFSAAARTIADILARYPAPPSAVRPAAPLMAAAETEASSVAGRLQTSFSQSGLFYESHLQGWYRGEVSGARLAQEPQMRFFQPADPAAPGARGDGRGPAAADAAPRPGNAAPVSTERPPPPTAAPVEARPDREDAARPAPRPLSEDANQALQGILRHQLETLATPVLRWEGDVWSGIFMALMIQVPADAPRQPHPDGGGDDQGGEEGEDDQRPWHSELTLDLAALGPVRVRLDMLGDDLRINMNTASEEVARQLRAGGERLRARLHGHGFEQVEVRVASDD